MGWRRFFRRAWWDNERARELESHIQIETDEYIARGPRRGGLSVRECLDYRGQSTVFEAVVGKDDTAVVMTGRSGSELLGAVRVTPNTFQALAVPPLLGRGLIDADAAHDAPPVAVV